MVDSEVEALRSVIAEARAASTRRAYASDVRRFVRWCEERQVRAFPSTSTTILLHLNTLLERGLKLSSITRTVVALSLAQAAAGGEAFREELVVKEFLRGLRRRLRKQPRREAPPLLLEGLRSVTATQSPSTRQGVRNRALLLVGWWGALRRSELVSLDVEDIRIDAAGVVLRIRTSKTDQEGDGAVLGLPRRSDGLCPVAALRAWLSVREDTESRALFVSVSTRNPGARLAGQAVERVLKAAVDATGIGDVRYTPHSLRAGFATEAARAGKPAHAIRRQTRHASLAMLERYIREGEVFVGNPGQGL